MANTGPYSDEAKAKLAVIEAHRQTLLGELVDPDNGPKLVNDKDKTTAFIALTNAMTSEVHKQANLESRHDLGTSAAETAESMAMYLKEAHKASQESFQKLPAGSNSTTVPDGLIEAEIVPGLMETGIIKPDLKTIMATQIDDDDDD